MFFNHLPRRGERVERRVESKSGYEQRKAAKTFMACERTVLISNLGSLAPCCPRDTNSKLISLVLRLIYSLASHMLRISYSQLSISRPPSTSLSSDTSWVFGRLIPQTQASLAVGAPNSLNFQHRLPVQQSHVTHASPSRYNTSPTHLHITNSLPPPPFSADKK